MAAAVGGQWLSTWLWGWQDSTCQSAYPLAFGPFVAAGFTWWSDTSLVGLSAVQLPTTHLPLGAGCSLLGGLEGALVHRRLLRGHYLASPKLVTGNPAHPVGCRSTFVTLSCKWEENPAGARPWKPVEGLLVLRLLMEQVPGKSRALKADDIKKKL